MRSTSVTAFSPTTFQPTLPARGATGRPDVAVRVGCYFNPRSPHGERRTRRYSLFPPPCHFNPRSPHGERHLLVNGLWHDQIFQPTLPARGATCRALVTRFVLHAFQPTLPARGATSQPLRRFQRGNHFNPRSPHGERHVHGHHLLFFCHFNPRSPHGERRWCGGRNRVSGDISTHAPRTGSD